VEGRTFRVGRNRTWYAPPLARAISGPAGWPHPAERRTVYNLYHLLSHLNHFGGGYAGGVEAALRALGR